VPPQEIEAGSLEVPPRHDGGGLADDALDEKRATARPVDRAPLSERDRRRQRQSELARASARVTAPGLCEEAKAARATLLAGFRTVEPGFGSLLIDPVLPDSITARVANALQVAQRVTAELVASPAAIPPPLVVVYRSLNQMREVARVNTSTWGYYDGAIHLSGNPNGGLKELEETLVHEYVHHVLVQQGVRLPMWLSEGTAILLARETWWRQPELALLPWARSTHLPFDSLVPAFAHATDEQTATHLYFQSFLMVELIRGRAGMQALRTVISRLGQGLVSPDDAFSEASGIAPSELDGVFHAWVQTVSLP